MGFTSVNSQLMSVPPYVLGSIVCIGCSMISDRLKTRGVVLLIVAPGIVIGFALLTALDTVAVKYFALFLCTAGAFTGSPFLLGWLVDNTAGPMVRAIASAFAVCLGCTGTYSPQRS